MNNNYNISQEERIYNTLCELQYREQLILIPSIVSNNRLYTVILLDIVDYPRVNDYSYDYEYINELVEALRAEAREEKTSENGKTLTLLFDGYIISFTHESNFYSEKSDFPS